MADNTVRLRYIVTDEGTIRVLDQAGKELGELERAAVKAGDAGSESLNRLGLTAEQSARALQLVGAAATAMAVGVAAALRQQLNFADDLTKLARSAGTSVEELSRLRVAAELSGVSMDELGRGLGLLNRRLVEAASGSGRAGNVFAALRIEFQNQEGQLRGNIPILEDVARVFAQLPDGPQKTAAAMELFGRSGAKFISLLNLGADGIRELIEENDRLGLSFDRTFGERAELVNDNLERIRLAGEGVALTFLERVAPSLATASERLLEYLGIARALDQENSIRGLEAKRDRILTDATFAQTILEQRDPLAGTIDPTPERRRALADEIEREIQKRRNAAEITGAINDVRNRLAGNDTPGPTLTQDDINQTLKDLAQTANESKPKTDALAESVTRVAGATQVAKSETAALTDQYGRLVTRSRDVANDLRAVTGELESQTQTISLDLGEAFRRLTTGGGDFDILDGFKNATQAAAADAFDAILGEKLSFDLEIQRNFAEDLPGFFESGLDTIRSLWSDGTADLVSTSQSASAQIGQAFGRSFTGIASNGQALAQQLSGLGVPVVGGTQVPLSPQFGNLAGGQFGQAGGQFVAIDAFGTRFSGSDAASVAGAASGQFGGGGGGFGAGGAVLGGAALLGAVIGELVTQLQEEEEVRIGRLRATRPAGVDVGGLTTTGALAGLGVGAAVTGVGVATGAITGATLGSAVPVIGTIIGAALGALVGAIASLFETKPQRSDLIQKGLGKLVAENPSFIEQGNFKASGRRGIEADRLFRPTEERRAFFESLGISFDANTDQFTIEDTLREGKFAGPDRVALENLILADPNSLEEQLRLPAFGLAAALTGGNAKDTADATNTLINNILLTGQEFSEEAKRQLLAVADAAGLDLFNTIEQLGINFTLAQSRFDDRGGRKPDIDRDDTLKAIEGVVELFSDDIPKGVDVLTLAAENLGEASFNTAGFFEDLTREIEIFGELADSLTTGLKGAITAGSREETGASVLARGGSLQDAVRAVGRQGSAFVSTLAENIRESMSVAITEGVFDAVEDSPSWQALTDQIAAAVKDPSLIGSLPSFIGGVVGANASQLNAAAVAQQELQRQFGALPTTLFAQADAFRDRADQLRFGQLTPEQQRARIDRDIERVGARIFGLYGDDIEDSLQAPELAELFGELGQLGERRAGLADALFSGGGVANERRRAAFVEESFGFIDTAGAGLGNLGRAQQDALTGNTAATENQTAATRSLKESNDSLRDAVEELAAEIGAVRATGGAVVTDAMLARFLELIDGSGAASAKFNQMAAGAR